MSKTPQRMETAKFTVITKKLPLLPLTTKPQSTKILNVSNVQLTQDEIDILKLGLSFTPTPKRNIAELKNDIFQFTRKLRLTKHYQNNNFVGESIVKSESTYTYICLFFLYFSAFSSFCYLVKCINVYVYIYIYIYIYIYTYIYVYIYIYIYIYNGRIGLSS